MMNDWINQLIHLVFYASSFNLLVEAVLSKIWYENTYKWKSNHTVELQFIVHII